RVVHLGSEHVQRGPRSIGRPVPGPVPGAGRARGRSPSRPGREFAGDARVGARRRRADQRPRRGWPGAGGAPARLMFRRRAALVALRTMVAVGLALVGPAAPVALAHSQLITSIPAGGEVMAEAPAEVRLVFSEPIDPDYSRLDVLDASGAVVVAEVGAPDP